MYNNYEYVNKSSSNIDTNLRAHFLKIYNYMGLGLIITAVFSYLIGRSPELTASLLSGGTGMLIMLAPFGFLLFMSFGVNKLSFSTLQILFWSFCAVMGVSISYIFILYSLEGIVRSFLITALTFLCMSLYGYTTKKDLSKFGSILIMGLVGIVIASVINIFMKSSAMELVISVLGIFIFTGLIAFNTQRIREEYYAFSNNDEAKNKLAIMASLNLYLNFLNLFLLILKFTGGRRD